MPRGKDSSSKSKNKKLKSPSKITNKQDIRNYNEIKTKKLFEYVYLVENEESDKL